MKYKTIKAELNPSSHEVTITIRENAGDRKNIKTKPHSAGFFHYPESLEDTHACQQLQTSLILQSLKAIQGEIRTINALLKPVLPADLSDYNHKWSTDNRVIETLRTTERRLAIMAKNLRKKQ